MGKWKGIFLGFVAVAFLSGCATVYSPAMGILMTDVKGPITTTGGVGTKTGKACAKSILGMVATGDASIATAAKNGGITRIQSVDHHSNHMVVIGEFCTIVTGS